MSLDSMPEVPMFSLLAPGEPAPVVIEHPDGASPFFLTCDHAGRLLPKSVGNLGLGDTDLERHIAWDIGIAGVSRLLAEQLDATLVMQIYSRLVIDCNRHPSVPSSISEISELTPIPGNVGLPEPHRRARQQELLEPYHDAITQALDRRVERGRETIIVSMHSFTPVFKGAARPWQVGVLYNRHRAFPHIVLDLFRAEADLVVGDNEPYFVSDDTDYTIPVHGERRELPHVELEIRQDLITSEDGQREWAERLVRILPEAHRRLRAGTGR